MRLIACLLLAFILMGPAAQAEDAVRTPASAADAVQAAAEKEDLPALTALARCDNPDPWLVAEVLDARGQGGVAVRFAECAPRKETETLAVFLAGVPKPPAQAAARAALGEAEAALARGDPKGALAALEGQPGKAQTIAAVRIHFTRGAALRALADRTPSLEAYQHAAQLAEKFGWLTMASRALVACGRVLWGGGDYEGAHSFFERLKRVEHRLGSDMGMGRAYYFLHLTGANLRRDRAEVLANLEKAQDLAESSGDDEYLAKTLGDLTELSQSGTREKLDAYCEAAAALSRVTGAGLASRFQPDLHRIARDRVNFLLNCASKARELDEEETAGEHAREARETAARDGNTAMETFARAFLATVEASLLEQSDRNAEALAQWEEARTLYGQLGTRRRRWLAGVLRRLASVHVRMGHLPQAYELVEKALGIYGSVRDAPGHCRTLILAAKLDLNMGRSRVARVYLANAEELARSLHSTSLASEVLIGQAQIHTRHARYSRARDLLRRALAIQDASTPVRVTGLLHLRLSQLQREMGAVEPALTSVQAAIEVLSAGKHPHMSRQAREHHARLLLEAGRTEEACRTLEELLAERRERKDDLGIAAAHDALADVRSLQGRGAKSTAQSEARFAEATALRTEALRLYLHAGAFRRAAIVRGQLGRDLYFAGDVAGAFKELDRAFQDCQALGDPSGAATCAHGLAEAYYGEKNWVQAMEYCERGLNLASDHGLDLAEGEGETARARLVPRYQPGAWAAFFKGDSEKLHHFFERGRAAVLLAALGGREALREARVPANLRVDEEKARAALVLAYEAEQKVHGRATLDVLRTANKELEAAQKVVRDAVEAIRQKVRMQADLAYPSVASIEDVQDHLRDTDAFVSYGEIKGSLVAVILTKKTADHVELAPIEKVRDAVQRLIGDEEDAVAPGVADEVRKLLLDKLALGAEVKRLLISPHGSLAYVPFALLDQEREICFLPSATVYAALRDEEDPAGRYILALGDPDYTSGKPGVAPSHPALPRSGDEVKAIADVKKGHVRLLGPAASETGFRRALEKKTRWRAVHLACHGIVDADDPRASRLALTRDGENDGYLHALEVFNLEVPADLVVLSGCKTGRGKVIEGEGLEGLTRAFMFAGAPRVIASLWDVEDEPTQALMNEFYRLWDGKDALGAAAALKAAQAYVRTHPTHPEWKDPTHWAAWVLWGLPD